MVLKDHRALVLKALKGNKVHKAHKVQVLRDLREAKGLRESRDLRVHRAAVLRAFKVLKDHKVLRALVLKALRVRLADRRELWVLKGIKARRALKDLWVGRVSREQLAAVRESKVLKDHRVRKALVLKDPRGLKVNLATPEVLVLRVLKDLRDPMHLVVR